MIRFCVALCAFLVVSGCAQLGELAAGNSVVPVSAQVTIAKGVYGFDVTYNAAANLYTAEQANVPAATKAKAKALLMEMLTCPSGATSEVQCTGYVATAHAAETAADSAGLAAAVANIDSLSAQVIALLPAQGSAP